MGLFTKPPPTATDLVEDEKTVGLDHASDEIEQAGYPPSINAHYVHPDIEKRVIRKMDLRIVSLVTALYVLAFLDRSNIGNAEIAGMKTDLHLVGNRYQWLLTIFCTSYASTPHRLSIIHAISNVEIAKLSQSMECMPWKTFR